jgi:GAF domain-containing protein
VASLVVHPPHAAPATVALVKPLTTLSAGMDSDVRIDEVRGVVAIQYDGSHYTATALEGAPLMVNGKKRDRALLDDGDTLQLGRTRVVFQALDRLAPAADVSRLGGGPDAATLAVLRLSEFTVALAQEPGTDKALARLLDAIIEVVNADKGFLIVVDEGGPRVEVARNTQRQDIENAVERLSDSIVARVLQTRQPVIVSDALNDAQFNASASVVNLKLSSVMCVPLIRRGELYGAVYVGNDRIANLFTERELTLMTSFCATAALLLERALELDELRTSSARSTRWRPPTSTCWSLASRAPGRS